MSIFDLLKPSTAATPSKGLLGDPQSQMMLGASLLSAGGPSLTPKSGFEGIPQTMALMQRQQMLKQEQERENQEREAQRKAVTGLGLNADLPSNILTAQYNSKFAKPESVDSFSIKSAQDLGLQGEGFFNVNDRTGKVTQIGGGGVTVNNNMPGDDKFAEGNAKYLSTMFGDLATDGVKAKTDLAMTNRLGSLLQTFDTGGGAVMKKMAGDIGINTENLSEIQAAQAIINRMVPEQRPAGSGPMSDADLALFKESLPRLMNQPGGNALIVNTMRNLSEYRYKQGQIAQLAMTGQLDRNQALEALMKLDNPLSKVTEVLQDGKQQFGSDEEMFKHYLGGQ